MIDYHARQMTGSTCGPHNCAAASCAMGIHAGSGGQVTLTSDQVRLLSKRSCVLGEDSPSGGLFISDVMRVGNLYSVVFNYGFDPVTFYKRWSVSEARTRLSSGYGAVFLGDYDQVPSPYRANTAFMGDHSLWAHDFRSDGTVCWHDPLRPSPIRAPFSVLVAYWQKPGSPIRGYAGWVKDERIVPPDTGTEDDVKIDFKVERWTLDGGPGKVTTLGAPKKADGTVDWNQRLALLSSTGDTNRRLELIERKRLSDPYTAHLDSDFYRALATYTLPSGGDCTDEIAADRAKATIVWKP